MNFYVDPSEGHDDFLMSLALAAEAARDFTPKTAKEGQGTHDYRHSCEGRNPERMAKEPLMVSLVEP